ncbi:RNA polymerase subunit sigma-70, partial [Peterkaempfera griseoplana]|uniref:RNA polymerase subunit sigma-70 n=1 Tax=Peterkaempfera griseoplana TaxID=66896 RepID=UPI0006E2FD58
EDLVQETYLRAWTAWGSFEGRSSVRTWLHRIATNLCLTALRDHRRRILPSGLGAPGEGAELPAGDGRTGRLWLEPFPGHTGDGADPSEVVLARSDLRLALVASLQHLPARQRAVFLLRDVLAYPAGDVAEMLGTSVAAVKSALQRARATLEEAAPRRELLAEPSAPEARAVLDRYMAAFESADMEGMAGLLRDDATLEVVPTGAWFRGKRACVAHLAERVLTAPGLYRMFPAAANGQPAAVVYARGGAGEAFTPFGVVVLTTDGRHITTLTTFADPGLVGRFGFPGVPPHGRPRHGGGPPGR